MTPREILAAAYTRSKRNKGSADIDEATEGLTVVQFALDRLYTLTARLLPEYFMLEALVSINAGRWALPSRAESIIRVENGAGVEVVVVPFTDRALYAQRKPAIYFAGRGFRSAGNSNDPVAEDLTFTYAPGAPAITIDENLTTADVWPEQHTGLLVDECAVYLSLKDVRIAEDLPVLKTERDDKARLYIAHLDHINRTQVRRTGVIPRVVNANIQNVLSLLAGNGGGE